MEKQELLKKLDILWKSDEEILELNTAHGSATVFEEAVKKLEEEIEKANTFGIPKEAFQLLLSQRMKENEELARYSLLPTRNFDHCMDYMRRRLCKELKYTSGIVEAGTVLQMMEDYYVKDAESVAKEKEKEAEEKEKREEERRKQQKEQKLKKEKRQKKEMSGPSLFDIANIEGVKTKNE